MTNGNEPAFLEANPTVNESHLTRGLTKREYFAAIALGGILANRELQEKLLMDAKLNHIPSQRTNVFEAVAQADLLIAELNKTESK